MNDVDIRVFQFDYDLTWMAFFLDASERIYSRFGGRDGQRAEGRVSVAALKYTMRLVLQAHRESPRVALPPGKPRLAEELSAKKGKGCMHCHHVWEGLRREANRTGEADQELFFVYPLPENIGVELDLVAGNRVAAIVPDSPAQRAGLRPGDIVDAIDRVPIRSQGDVMTALHHAPSRGSIAVTFRRQGRQDTVTVELASGWKRTDLSWRQSLKNLGK
jgi:membrane-associated protease RseP (regulator of RpoE activity)